MKLLVNVVNPVQQPKLIIIFIGIISEFGHTLKFQNIKPAPNRLMKTLKKFVETLLWLGLYRGYE